MHKGLFLDRDGVIIEEVHLPSKKTDIKLKEGICDLIVEARKLGFKIIMVTNQTVVSRGILSFSEMVDLNQYVLDKLKSQSPEALFDGVYICPHHPNATIEEYKVDCECRKPRSGMLLKASMEHQIHLDKSLLIGDRISDIVAGNRMKVKTLLITNEFTDGAMIETSEVIDKELVKPDLIISEIKEAIASLESL